MTPLVSVMMPCYNAAHRIQTALTSLLIQSYPNWECLLVDDGSTDNLREELLAFNDSRIRVFHLESNFGRGYAHQFALQQARGEFLCTLDADDWLYPTKLEVQVRFLSHNPDITAVSLEIALVDENEHLVGIHFREGPKITWMSGIPPRNFCFGAAMLRRQDALKTGYDPSFRRSQDFDFFCRLLEGKTYAVLPEVGYVYHFTAGSNLSVVLEGLESNRRFFSSGRSKSRWRYARQWMLCLVKSILYRLLALLGLWEVFQSSRRQTPRTADVDTYQQWLTRLRLALPSAQDLAGP